MRLLRDLVGHTLSGRYRVVASVAGGGMGEVFRGHDLLLDRKVAIKVLQPSLASEPELVERFKQEARSAARLNHPNIVSVHDWGAEDDRTYYMVMEYVPGTDVREVLTLGGPLDPGQAVETIASVCEALSVAHAAGLVHRDIKPENILIARDGTVKVTDFGIAAVADADFTLPGGTIPGTIRYMSPEQARGEDATLSSDIWAAGAMLFELLTGAPLFDGGGMETLQRRAVEQPRLPSEMDPSLPAVLDDIVAGACDPDPERRYENAHEMARELRLAPIPSGAPLNSLLDEVTGDVVLPDMAPTTYIKRRGRRRTRPLRTLALIATSALLLLVGFKAAAALVGPTMIRVPSVVGRDLVKAKREITAAGLLVAVTERARRASTEAGEVLSQSPPRGELEEGKTVSLVVSAGLPLSDVPDLRGMSLDAARVRLHAAQLEMGEVSVEFSLKDKGTVIDQRPANGRQEWGTKVELVVSRGPRQIPVPDVVGLDSTKATDKLAEAGFETSVVEVYSSHVRKGSVVATNPVSGMSVAEGSTIELQVSVGPQYQKVHVPDVRGLSVDQAEVKLSSVGLRWEIENSCDGGTTVVETHPIPGTVVRENTVVALFVC
jgi:serine/threonine-protein kinase